MIILEAVQAKDGDCFLLGTDDPPTLIVLDGGSRGTYPNFLRERLCALKSEGLTLRVRLVVVSHIDADHITGVLDMLREQDELRNNGEIRWLAIDSLWHNAFRDIYKDEVHASSATVAAASLGSAPAELLPLIDGEKARAVVASVRQGNDVNNLAKALGIKVNREENGGLIMATEQSCKRVAITDKLSFVLLGPRKEQLARLKEEWLKSKEKAASNSEAAVAADYLNRTIPNLSSIVFLAEYSGGEQPRRWLFTGDAGGDLILQGLKSAGLLDARGRIHLDLLKVQHHGSNHSIEKSFLEQVSADHYVISGNGNHGIPSIEVMEWLSAARKNQSYTVYLTNRSLSGGKVDLTPALDRFLQQEGVEQPLHRYVFRENGMPSLIVPPVDAGVLTSFYSNLRAGLCATM